MTSKIFSYQLTILETYLDSFGHVNNAMYLTLYEEARWDLINKNGYSLKKIKETGMGPILLNVKMDFLKELKARDCITIESQCLSYKGKIGKLVQKMSRSEEICSTAEFTIALFNLHERKLIKPTAEWLAAIGWEDLSGIYA
jgi:thioesterase III